LRNVCLQLLLGVDQAGVLLQINKKRGKSHLIITIHIVVWISMHRHKLLITRNVQNKKQIQLCLLFLYPYFVQKILELFQVKFNFQYQTHSVVIGDICKHKVKSLKFKVLYCVVSHSWWKNLAAHSYWLDTYKNV
jgi:hypothetical protein